MTESKESADAVGTPPVARAGRHAAAHIRFWAAAIMILAADLGSKTWAFRSLAPDEVRTVVPGVLEFRRSLNDGAVFGSLTGHVELFLAASVLALGFVLYLFWNSLARQWVLHVALGAILAGTLGNFYDRTYQVADIVTYKNAAGRENSIIGRVVNGDSEAKVRLGDWPEGTRPQSFVRSEVSLRRQGVVRDFLKFVPKFPDWVPKLARRDVWPWIFNVADAALVCGVGVLLLGTGARSKGAVPSAAKDA
jgi:lipoprotein signal peptidase